MDAVLRTAGPGNYLYGWEMNLEASREEELRQIDGTTVQSVRRITVDAVDFSLWSSWDDYWHATSNNIRRNAKKASQEIPDLAIDVRSGRRSLVQIPALVRLRAEMYRRKRLGFDVLGAAAGSIITVLSCPEHFFVALATGREEVLAAFSGYAFGPITYYIHGGSSAENSGASWYLMMTMLRQAFERAPGGTFVMGYRDHPFRDDHIAAGLLRSMLSCRVTHFETSMIRFAWQNPDR